MVVFMRKQTKELELLKQLIGEWSVGIAMKTSGDKIVSGCGEMTAKEICELGINSEIETCIEGYEDYYENDMWSFDRVTAKCIFSSLSLKATPVTMLAHGKMRELLRCIEEEPLRTKN